MSNSTDVDRSMSQQPTTSDSPDSSVIPSAESTAEHSAAPPPSYVKLAMRNMVRKRGKSLYHFALTTITLLGVLVGLAYLTR
jgi:hypothetical protein